MEKELKFKKEWFDVLNRCDRTLRMDVIEAVFQYFFAGAKPDFDDDARMIAFGFIRADIDATRRRREQRLARKEKTRQPAPTPAPDSAKADPKTPEKPERTSTDRISPPTVEEREKLYGLVLHWNAMVKGTDLQPIDTTLSIDSEEYRPALRALRRLPHHKVFTSVKEVRSNPGKLTFAQFFDSLRA